MKKQSETAAVQRWRAVIFGSRSFGPGPEFADNVTFARFFYDLVLKVELWRCEGNTAQRLKDWAPLEIPYWESVNRRRPKSQRVTLMDLGIGAAWELDLI